MKAVIVGGGVAGLGIGWRLAQAGGSVTVLERAQPGSGASFAAAGMIAAVAEMLDAPAPEVEFSNFSRSLWPSFAAELEQASGISLAYRQNGALLLDRPAIPLPDTQWLDAAGLHAHAPMLAANGALWAPAEAQVDSRALAAALAIAFRRADGTLVVNEAVTAIERQDGRAVAARTPFGRYGGDVFILAAGAWSGLLEAIPVTPVKGQMIALAAPAGAPLPGPVIWGNGVYLVPRRGRLLVGATVEEAGFDTSLSDAARNDLFARARALIPDLARWPLVEHWAGLRPRSPDGLPLLGPADAPNLFVAAGQYRNGILFAPAIADHMRDQVLDRAAIIPAFDPQRFR